MSKNGAGSRSHGTEQKSSVPMIRSALRNRRDGLLEAAAETGRFDTAMRIFAPGST